MLELREGLTAAPSLKQRIAFRAAAWMEQRILDASDIVHYNSTYTRRVMEQSYPRATAGKGIVLPGWVDDARFRPSEVPRNELRRRLGPPWEPGIATFFTLRRLVPRMGIDALVEAAASLARNGRACRLVIGGDGPQRTALEAQVAALGIGDRVAFLGRIPEASLADSFAAADCFVLPTRALECFGLIVLESYACGVPVIGVPVGAIPETVGLEFQSWLTSDNPPRRWRNGWTTFRRRVSVDPRRARGRPPSAWRRSRHDTARATGNAEEISGAGRR